MSWADAHTKKIKIKKYVSSLNSEFYIFFFSFLTCFYVETTIICAYTNVLLHASGKIFHDKCGKRWCCLYTYISILISLLTFFSLVVADALLMFGDLDYLPFYCSKWISFSCPWIFSRTSLFIYLFYTSFFKEKFSILVLCFSCYQY